MKLILSFFISIVLFSCAEHQYLTISGVDINKNDRNEFVYENDTVKLIYHFRPDYGKMLISVFNQTGEPLVIDWWKSAMIIDNEVFSFYNPNARFNGQVDKDTSGIRKSISNGSEIYVADFNGTVFLNESSQFIPSHAQIRKELTVFAIDTLKNLPQPQTRKDTIHLSYTDFITYRKISFEKEKSPLNFRSYMSFRIGKGSEAQEFSIEHKFYVSEVWKIKSGLQDIPQNITSRGDMIYLAP